MFKRISLNEDIHDSKKRNGYSDLNQRHQFEYGRPEWNQTITTTNKIHQNIINVYIIINN
jgi:hypothetical protein